MSIKTETFRTELDTIISPNIRQFCIDMLEDAPDYFFTVAASSTGKYHPKTSLGEGGLVRHTKALVGIANDLLFLEQFNFDDDTKDMIRVAGILHDAKKHGDNGSVYTVFDHPIIAAEWVRNSKTDAIPQADKNKIASMIASHMGSWNTDKRSNIVLPKPVTAEQQFVHMCDYLASRKHLEYIFEQSSDDCISAPSSVDPNEFVMPFGKYKGQKFVDIKSDTDYLSWLYNNCTLREPLKTFIEKEI